MNGYIDKLLMKYGHLRPSKSQISLHKHREVIYGAQGQLTPEKDKSPPLDKEGIKRIHVINGALLYYTIEVDNKLFVGLSSIGSQQTATTKHKNEAINQLLNYSATYHAYGILYCSRNMVLCAHYDAGFHNKSKVSIRAGAHISIQK